jgi:hypothetical protein
VLIEENRSQTFSGTDVMILTIFSPKIGTKKLAFLTQNKAKLFKKLPITFFEKNANFFAEHCQKSQKIVTPGAGPSKIHLNLRGGG